MKTRFYFLLAACCFILQAQGQNKECDEKISEIDKLVKEDKLAEAYGLWSDAGKCIAANETIYTDGEKILQYKIDNAATAEAKQELIAKTANLYERYDKNFPGNNKSNLVKKAMLFNRYKAASEDEIYTLLDKAFKTDAANFTDANGLQVYFNLYFKQFTAGDKGIKEDDVFTRQDAIYLRLNQLYEANMALPVARDYATAIDGIKALVAPIATCDKLLKFYGKNFEAKKTDASWLESASGTLASKSCTSDKLFLSIADEWYKVAPTSRSAYNLGLANMRNRNRVKGIEYFNISADLDTNTEHKAKTYYTIATGLATSDKAQAMAYLKKALAAKPSFGKAYLLMAQMYSGAAECGETPFQKKAVYLLAAQAAKKAGEVDAAMKNIAAKQAGAYLEKAPSKSEINDGKMAGKTITFKCWINESVTIPQS